MSIFRKIYWAVQNWIDDLKPMPKFYDNGIPCTETQFMEAQERAKRETDRQSTFVSKEIDRWSIFNPNYPIEELRKEISTPAIQTPEYLASPAYARDQREKRIHEIGHYEGMAGSQRLVPNDPYDHDEIRELQAYKDETGEW